jgi:hypothetical protein
MKKTTLITFTFILFTLILVACGNAAQENNWQNYQNDNLGIAFELPETWVTQEINGVITFAVDQEALDTNIATGAGGTVMLATVDDFDGQGDPSDIIDLFMEYFELGRELEKLGEPEALTIQDQLAQTVSYRGTVQDQTGLFIAVIITNEDHIALVLAFDGSEDEQHKETLERVTQTINVYPPTE